MGVKLWRGLGRLSKSLRDAGSLTGHMLVTEGLTI